MTAPTIKTVSAEVVAKAVRACAKADHQLERVLTSAADAPIWSDEEFWQTRWPAMVERSADAHERLATLVSQ